ncbi:salivary glue protein Sgs-3-like [Poecilia reticulata]|uniref:salivary glue protein Sgs-3-like n=1 Tax=Poecilia reticulata TaxID=8081 RepID=UPI0007E945EF|nr:PREDICTED: salivary glue protein Sgs-3-like [Poecilia reticulata]
MLPTTTSQTTTSPPSTTMVTTTANQSTTTSTSPSFSILKSTLDPELFAAHVAPLTTAAPQPPMFTFMSNITTKSSLVTKHPPNKTAVLPTTDQHTTTTTALPITSILNSKLDTGPYYVLALNAKISTTLSMETDSATILNLIKDELMRQGLPPDIIVELLSSGAVKFTTASP